MYFSALSLRRTYIFLRCHRNGRDFCTIIFIAAVFSIASNKMSLGTYQWLLGGENEVHSHTEALFDLKEQNYGFYKKKTN